MAERIYISDPETVMLISRPPRCVTALKVGHGLVWLDPDSPSFAESKACLEDYRRSKSEAPANDREGQ